MSRRLTDRPTVLRWVASVLIGLVAAAGLPALAAPSGAEAPTTRLAISFKRHATTSNVEQAHAAEDAGEVVRVVPAIKLRAIVVPEDKAAAIRKRLLGRADVLAVEVDPMVEATLTPNDPSYAAQWAPPRVDLPAAWDLTTGSSSVTIAIVDTGVTATSPDLPSSKMVPGRNVIWALNGWTGDDNGHGTQSASVAAMVGNNGSRAAGACWACKIMPVKVLGSNGSGSASDVAAGIVWAANNGADVISLSLGGTTGTTSQKQAVEYAESKGIPVIAAAGNDASPAFHYPAAYSTAVSVAATDQADNRSSYSNYGSWVKLAAPGTSSSLNRSGSVVSFSGTSAATPLVAGTVGLMLSVAPSLTPAQIRTILRDTADPAGVVLAPGSGRLDADEAVADAAEAGGTTTTTSSTSTTSTSTSTSSTSTSTSSTSTSTSTTSSTTTSTSTSSTTTTTVAVPTTTSSTSGFTGSGGTRSRTLTVKAGAVSFRSTCSYCSTQRVDILNAQGQVVATASGASPVTIAAVLPAGTYTFRTTTQAYRYLTQSITSPS